MVIGSVRHVCSPVAPMEIASSVCLPCLCMNILKTELILIQFSWWIFTKICELFNFNFNVGVQL